MAYEILMPQLSDSMDEGKLISWKIKEADVVKKGDLIAEVESDKAIMEIESFRDGVVESIKVKEGQSVPVGTVIATIATKEDVKPSNISKKETQKESPVAKQKEIEKPSFSELEKDESTPIQVHIKGYASPKAKALGAKYDIDIKKLQKSGKLPTPAHHKDIKEFHQNHYFTPKAVKLLKLYHLDPAVFGEKRKYDSDEILEYIKVHNIPLPKPIEPFQKALIRSVENAAKKPVYHIYDQIDSTLLLKYTDYSLTVWLVKLFAKAMIKHESSRTTLKEDRLIIYPNASISLALSYKNRLYMPVFKDADLMSTAEIDEKLKTFETKAQNENMSASDMRGSTFGISNLGMFGIKSFDAMINQDDSAIAAVGAESDGKISITLTLDHRVINGYQAAMFMQTLKELAQDEQNFKE
jgi:pyruvate dehydrogenase E2 component (dihydrolipoamide acetyltransferase)